MLFKHKLSQSQTKTKMIGKNMLRYKSYATKGAGKKHAPACQDACFYDSELSIIVVADGLGDKNCFRSSRGSQIAVECASAGIQEFLNIYNDEYIKNQINDLKTWTLVEKEFDQKIHTLINYIITQWYIRVEIDFTDNPFTEEELNAIDEKHRIQYAEFDKKSKAYATTLIAAAAAEHYWFGIHIGDGRFTVLYPDGSFAQPVPWDDRCFLNNTTTIRDQDAHERTRYHFSAHRSTAHRSTAAPVAIYLCSDGIDDNYPVEKNEEYLYNVYKTISLTFAEAGFESTCKQLDGLVNKFATEGKADDTSLGVIIDMDGLKKVVSIWQAPIETEKQTSEPITTENDEKPSSEAIIEKTDEVEEKTHKMTEPTIEIITPTKS